MQKLSILFTCTLALAACSSNGDRLQKTSICSKNFLKGHEFKVDKSKKVDLETDKSLNSGELDLQSVDVYILDSARDVRLHVRHHLKANREVSQTEVVCIGGSAIKPKMQVYHLNLPVIEKLILGNGKTIYGTRMLQIELSDEGAGIVKTDMGESQSAVEGSLKAIYSDYSDVQQYYFESQKVHQIRNSLAKDIPAERNSATAELQIRTTQSFAPAAEDSDANE